VDALRRLEDPELRRRLGSNAATRSESFSLASIAEEYRTLYAGAV
jgi:glycosyltransferase involved in cell wall biosynthesis